MKKIFSILFTSLFAVILGLSATPKEAGYAALNAEEVIQGSYLGPNFSSGTNGITYNGDRINGLYFQMDKNAAPYNSDWSLEYKADSLSNLVIEKADGTIVTDVVRSVDSGLIVKYGEKDYYIKFEAWTVDANPEYGDKLTIKGDFVYNDGQTNHRLNIQETTFLFYKGSDDKSECAAYPIPSQLTNITTMATSIEMPPYDDHYWHFMFWAYGVYYDDAPVTGDNYHYYATSKDNILLDGVPSAKILKPAIKRRDKWDSVVNYEFYVCNESTGQNFNACVGQVIVIDGLFLLNMPTEDNSPFGIQIDCLAFVRTGTGNNDYRIIDLGEYLVSKLNDDYNPNLYKEEDFVSVTNLLSEAKEAILNESDAKEIYRIYNQYSNSLGSFEYDEEAAQTYLLGLKTAAKKEIGEYANLDNYFDAEKEQISQLIQQISAQIDEQNKKSDIDTLVESFKTQVAQVKTKGEIMSDAILNQSEGYENYLAIYDVTTLKSLNLSTITYNGSLESRETAFNTNIQENNLFNTFIPSVGNDNGNVVFKFKYNTDAIPFGGGNVSINLRGMPYYGYKFSVDTNTRGCFFEGLSSDGRSIWIAGEGNLFVCGPDYEIEVGAVDLIEGDLTWIFMKVNGNFSINKIIDSIGICTNPRVAICPNGDMEGYNDYDGDYFVLESDNEPTTIRGESFISNFTYVDGNKNTMHVTCSENSLPFAADKTIEFYPADENSVRLIGDVETPIADPSKPFITKYSETDYQLDVSKIYEAKDGDMIAVDGVFNGFDTKTSIKFSFTTAKTSYIYHADSDCWEQFYTLEDTKQNAVNTILNYFNINDYDQEDRESIDTFVASSIDQINNAASKEEVQTILDSTLTSIDSFKTTLRKYQDAAIEIVNSYKNEELNNYRKEEQDDIASMKELAVEKINNAVDTDQINEIVINLKFDIDELPTDADYAREELVDAKKQGIQEIQNYYASLGLDNYSESELNVLNSDTMEALNKIKVATSIEEVSKIVSDYKDTHPQKEAPSSETKTSGGCGGNIAATSIIFSSLALLSFVLISIKKYRKEDL